MKNKPVVLTITKRSNIGMLPLFVQLAHKGLDKSQPAPVFAVGTKKTFSVPVDILTLALTDTKLADDITGIEFTYDQTP